MRSATKRANNVLTDTLAFLDDHRLPPTPENYRLAYLFVTEANARLTQAVLNMTEGQIRLQAEDVRQILIAHTGVAHNDTVSPAPQDLQRSLRSQAMKLADLTQDTAKATSQLGHDLVEGIAGIDAETGSASLRATVVMMAQRVKTAEQKFAAAANELDTLRQDLEAARNDAFIDDLTGLPNRRSINREFASLAGKNCAIAIIDVDHFKTINDSFGHSVGDRVLRIVADHIKAECKPHLAGRWGGEEFVVVFKNTTTDQAKRILDNARISLSRRQLRLKDTEQMIGAVTFSAGLAVGSNPVDLLKIADEQLYTSKRNGRNQITST